MPDLTAWQDLTAWLTEPAPGRGVHFAADDGGWTFISYARLAERARQVGAELAAAEVRPGDVVCMLMTTGLPCLATFFGCWAAGATPCLIVPPAFQARKDYVLHLARVLREAEPAVVAVHGGYEAVVGEAVAAAGRTDKPWIYQVGPAEIHPGQPGDFAVLQFTSGSSAAPRGVRVSWDNLRANTTMYRKLLGWRDQDAMASWVPLHHDMGLVGALLTTVSAQSDLWLMQPEEFIRRPAQWLSSLQPGMATHSISPGFAFAYLARKIQPEQVSELDLSRWRTATIGAEKIDPAALASFARLARPSGFSSRVYRPGYGLAEATLIVSLAAREGEGALLRPDPSSFRMGESVVVTQTGRLGDEPASVCEGWLIGHGRPAPSDGVELTIVDSGGAALPEGHLGEITVAGPSVTAGYHKARPGGSARFVGRELRTGDAGFLYGDDLFVLGRMGESLKVNGTNVYVEDLDLKVAAATGLDRSWIAAISADGTGHGGVVLFVEAKPDHDWIAAACETLRGALGLDCPFTVIAGSRGLIKKTSSSKPRRRHMWELLLADDLPAWARVVAERLRLSA